MELKPLVDKIYNCCSYCHTHNTIKIEKIEPSISMNDGVTMQFKCKQCNKTYETDYINAVSNNTIL